jgi:hypothetical protein
MAWKNMFVIVLTACMFGGGIRSRGLRCQQDRRTACRRQVVLGGRRLCSEGKPVTGL